MTSNAPLWFLTVEDFPPLARAREVITSVSSIASYQRVDVPDGASLVLALTNLGINFYNGNRLSEAEEILGHAIRIQECINHGMHHHLLRPLITLGVVFARQRHFERAESMLLRALVIAGKTDASTEEHRLALTNLIYIYQEQSLPEKEIRMREYLHRLLAENPFIVKDRHSRPGE